MSIVTLALVRQDVRSQSMTISMLDTNGFTLSENGGLKHCIADITAGNTTAHNIIEA